MNRFREIIIDICDEFILEGDLTGTGNITRTGDITETGNATITGNLTAGSYIVSGTSLIFTPSQTTQTFTNAAGSARTEAGTALTASLYKRGTGAGSLVEVFFANGVLANSQNAVAAAQMTFNETIPSAYRPSVDVSGVMNVENNAAANTMANFKITTAGVVTISGGLNFINFTNGAACSLKSNAYICYLSAS